MNAKFVLAALTMIVALGGWATTEAADRDDQYSNGYYHPDRHAYYYRHYPDQSYTYYYDRDGRRHYSYEHPHRDRYDYYSYNRVDPYGIERHDTN